MCLPPAKKKREKERKQRSERSTGEASQTDAEVGRGGKFLGQKNSRCKGLAEGQCVVCSRSREPARQQEQSEPGGGVAPHGSAGRQGGTPQSLKPGVRTLFFHPETGATGWLQGEEGHDLM